MNTVEVTDEMVDRACKANMHPLGEPSDTERRHMRKSLEAALAAAAIPAEPRLRDALITIRNMFDDEGQKMRSIAIAALSDTGGAAIPAEPVAWFVMPPDDDYYGRGPATLRFHPVSADQAADGYFGVPLYATPQDSAALREAKRQRDEAHDEVTKLCGEVAEWKYRALQAEAALSPEGTL